MTKRIFSYQTHLAWAGLVLLVVFLRPPARDFVYVNEATYATVGQQLLLGAELYHDAADWEGPVGYLLYAAVLRVTGGSVVAIHLFGLLVFFAVVVCAAALAHLWSGPKAALLAALMTVVFLAHTVGLTVEMDLFMAAFSAAAFLCLVSFLTAKKPHAALPVISGVFAVLAASCKQIALLDCGALLVGAFLIARHQPTSRRARSGLRLLLAGVALGVLLVAVLVVRYSNLQDFVAWVWVIPAVAQSAGLAARLHSLAESMIHPISSTALIWAFGIVAAIDWVRRSSNTGSYSGQRLPTPVGWLLVLWMAGGIVGSCVSSYPLQYHFTQPAVPLSILASVGVVRCIAAMQAKHWQRYLLLGVALCLILSIAPPLRHAAWVWRDRVFKMPDNPQVRAALDLSAQTTRTDRILVLDHNPGVVFWSKRRVASRYLVLEHLLNHKLWEQLPRYEPIIGELAHPRQIFLKDLRAHRPKFVLLPDTDWWQKEVSQPGNQDLLDKVLAGYRRVDTAYGYQWYVCDKP